MNKIYYLHSEQGSCEAICICEENRNIENPLVISAVYPVGVIFSKILHTLKPWIENPYKVSMQETLKRFSNEDSSFSSISCKDDVLKSIFNVILSEDKSIQRIRPYDEFQPSIIMCISYINLCCNDKDLEKTKVFDRFVFSSGFTYPPKSIYPEIDVKDAPKLKEGITDHFTFKPNVGYKSKRLFSIATEKSVTNNELVTPLTVYEISDVLDLILASVSAVFSQGYSIGKCRFCENYFVFYDKKRKYCENLNKNIKMGCYESANKKRIADKRASQSQRLYNSLREMYSRKSEEEYENFKKESKEWNRKIRNNEASEEEYVAWLKSKYARKYKK